MSRPHALVTGGAQGIGRALVTGLAGEGWHVTSLDLAPGPESAAGDGIEQHVLDVRDETGLAALAERMGAAGDGRLDLLVNNAGVMQRKSVAELDLGDWHRVLDTHLTGAFLCVRSFLPLLRRARGAIVNIASTRAQMSEPDTEAYAAAKGGLVALTHALAVSLGPEVRVNCISPGWIDTDGEELTAEDHAQHPAGRVGEPGDILRALRFLADPANGFVTGIELVVDGGMTRRMIYA